MIAAWLSTQPERVRAVLDPSWSPVRAAVVLAARHEQEAVASLDEFLWFEMLRYERAQARIAELEEKLQNEEGAHEYTQSVLGSVNDENKGLRSRVTKLKAERETLLAAMGPLGTPPMPELSERGRLTPIQWLELAKSYAEGAASVAPNGQVMVGLPNDPRLP